MLNDSELLLGIFAVREEFVGVSSLAQALHQRLEAGSGELGSLLVGGGHISELQRALLQGLVNEELGMESDTMRVQSSAELLDSVRQALDRAREGKLTDNLQTILACDENESIHKTSSSVRDHDGIRFEIIDRHAIGGLGEVFLAKDLEISRKVALKRIRAELTSNEMLRTRFYQEAEITGRLEHPGVVPVYALGTDEDDNPYYTMRFIRGDSLDIGIREFHKGEIQRKDFDSVEFRSLLGTLIEVCHAIAYAHSRGVIHRDIKPQNIMVGKYGETLVVDWGLAKALYGAEQIDLAESLLVPDSHDGTSPTRLGSAIGTPTYMSPEQASGEVEDVGPASDIYSLGATLYHILTGKPPRFGGDIDDLIRQAIESDFPTPRSIKPQVPPVLEAICLKAMSAKPRDRYRSPKELAADLERYLAGEAISIYRESGVQRLNRWIQNHRTLVATLLLATLLLLSSLLVASYSWQRTRERQLRRQLEFAKSSSAPSAKAESDKNELAELSFGTFGIALAEPSDSGADDQSFVSTYQSVPCLTNQQYRITLWAKAKGLGSDGAMIIVNDQSDAPVIKLPGGSYDWRKFQAAISSGDQSTLKLEFRARRQGVVSIDRVSASAVETPDDSASQ